MSSQQNICPDCGTINSVTRTSCEFCGCSLARTSPSARTRSSAGENMAEWIRPVIRTIIICAVIALIGWLVYVGFKHTYKAMQPIHPHPTDPFETTSEFFYALQNQDYQTCYKFLVKERKAAVVGGQQSRENAYFPHFDRIRQYLTKYAAQDFTATMDVSPDGHEVVFDGGVVLNLTIEPSKGYDDKTHYGIKEINEFPIDMAPKTGVEQYYRGLGQAIESLGDTSNSGDIDDPFEVIADRPGESKGQRQRRMIDSFKRARQLDTRHTILEWIIKEFYQEPQTQAFLSELTRDQSLSPHLRRLAQQALDYAQSQQR